MRLDPGRGPGTDFERMLGCRCLNSPCSEQTLRNLSHERSAADELVAAGAVEALARVVSADTAASESAWRAAAAVCQIADWPAHKAMCRASWPTLA